MGGASQSNQSPAVTLMNLHCVLTRALEGVLLSVLYFKLFKSESTCTMAFLLWEIYCVQNNL